MGRHYYSGRNVEKALSVEDLRHMAQRRLPGFVFEYLEGGAENEVTLKRNRMAFHQLEFVPRTLVRAGSVDASKSIFGGRSSLPIVVAPTGFCGLFARDGDLCLANAAASAGVPFVQSIVSNARIESVAKTAGLRHWMQIYVFRSPAFTEQVVARALAAGCEALVITTDATVYGNREWDRRNYAKGTNPTFANKLDILRHPRWMMDVLAKGIPPFQNLLDFLPPGQRKLADAATWSRNEVDPDLDWERVAWIRSLWPRKLIIKGVLSIDDAGRARDVGADGIVLTNHGGRQLDGTVSPMTVLPSIARDFRQDMTILIDSGFRRGTDVVKALALGADAVLLGRAALYGLAAGGEAGAKRALTILGEEIRRTLALLGRPSLSLLDDTCLKSAL
ncbi:alpha-hydroxy acid oxidase [Microvirga yunnanensis]|uniref:alpha-hydroxy acid oxidase n=1 Tax=Microvirga yunnanensis TaxID=2953740 RepID=UPI0021C78670|nr:alpha-hydroxy acid oxidase [Microvirga sp. HBU65207]